MNRCSFGNRLPKFMKAGSSHLAIVTFLVCIPFLAGKLANLKLRHYRCQKGNSAYFSMRSHLGTFLELAMWTLELRKLLHFLDFYCQPFYGRAITLLDFHSAMLPLVSAGYVALYRLPPNGKFPVKYCSLPDSRKK